MPGFKNVVFGGEGLFVTTLTGPGTVWLQGMPPDRMINEIARRVPSGGIGMGIPIGMGGGAGSEGAEAVDGDEIGDETDDEDVLSGTEESIQADRNATVASSGLGDDNSMANVEDPDSPSALFGDAAAAPETDSTPNIDSNTNIDSFEDSTSFSNEEEQFDDFEDTFSTDNQSESDRFQEDETSFDTGTSGSEEDSGSGLLGTLWDLFTDKDE